jgi:hypothetical protein
MKTILFAAALLVLLAGTANAWYGYNPCYTCGYYAPAYSVAYVPTVYYQPVVYYQPTLYYRPVYYYQPVYYPVYPLPRPYSVSYYYYDP